MNAAFPKIVGKILITLKMKLFNFAESGAAKSHRALLSSYY